MNDDYQANGAGSPLVYLDLPNFDMDFNMHESSYFDGHCPQIIQSQPTSFSNSPVEHHNQSLESWSTNNTGYQPSFCQHHWSVSTHSSISSDTRSSDNSFFPQFQNRASTISTDSSLSNLSNLSRNYYRSQAEHSLTGNSSLQPLLTPSPGDGVYLQTSKKRIAPRTPPKDYYKTCESRKQRARPSDAVQKYFCTICKESFRGKADWKRHEETYQERIEEFQCGLCSAKYFLDKDFVKHHVERHDCAVCNTNIRCTEKKHIQEARRPRKSRTGWGCGFCYHFSNNWTERCNHIANHFDQDSKTMGDWNHSFVIYSLLQRPAILKEWKLVLRSKNRKFIGFTWNPQTTARVEGYPDSNNTLQLQDALEYFTVDEDAAALAQKAFDLAHPKVARERPGPPVPPKDYHLNYKVSLPDARKEKESWEQLVNSVVCDELFPTGVTYLENGLSSDTSGSWLDTSS